jgi:hypothetical protein
MFVLQHSCELYVVFAEKCFLRMFGYYYLLRHSVVPFDNRSSSSSHETIVNRQTFNCSQRAKDSQVTNIGLRRCVPRQILLVAKRVFEAGQDIFQSLSFIRDVALFCKESFKVKEVVSGYRLALSPTTKREGLAFKRKHKKNSLHTHSLSWKPPST